MSRSLFDSPTVRVEGFHWCAEPKTVGMSALTAGILCRSHNSQLSVLDSGVRHVVDVLKLLGGVHRYRKKTIRQVDGPRLERWFLKTTLNLFHVQGGTKRYSFADREAQRPPRPFVETVFGSRSLERPMGLYAAVHNGQRVRLDDSLFFSCVYQDQQRLAGALYDFLGLKFLLWLDHSEPPRRIGPMTSLEAQWHNAQPMYHAREIRQSERNFVMRFNWH